MGAHFKCWLLPLAVKLSFELGTLFKSDRYTGSPMVFLPRPSSQPERGTTIRHMPLVATSECLGRAAADGRAGSHLPGCGGPQAAGAALARWALRFGAPVGSCGISWLRVEVNSIGMVGDSQLAERLFVATAKIQDV